jgi:hypothetical protein
MNTDDKRNGFEELAHRENDGIEVSLRWNRHDDRLSVVLCDTRTNEMLELAVNPAEALDVFHHPYAFAAFRGIELQVMETAGV